MSKEKMVDPDELIDELIHEVNHLFVHRVGEADLPQMTKTKVTEEVLTTLLGHLAVQSVPIPLNSCQEAMTPELFGDLLVERLIYLNEQVRLTVVGLLKHMHHGE